MAAREIIFRGKRLDNGEWVEGCFGQHTSLDAFIIVRPYPAMSGGWDALGFYEVYPETVGQYTGLMDRNGNRVFEGDIVKDASIGMLGDVVFSITGVPSFGINDVCYGLQYHDGFWHDLEVIGKIHDNPELLGGNEDG